MRFWNTGEDYPVVTDFWFEFMVMEIFFQYCFFMNLDFDMLKPPDLSPDFSLFIVLTFLFILYFFCAMILIYCSFRGFFKSKRRA